MMNHAKPLAFLALAAALAACASDDDRELVVQGTLTQSLSVDNARAIAIGDDGRTFWAYLDADRDFTLRLPVGHSYRIAIANSLPSGAQVRIAHLVLKNGASRSEWLGANGEGIVDLGTLRVVEPSGVTTACSSCRDHDDDDDDHQDGRGRKHRHDDDKECREKKKPHDHKDKICKGHKKEDVIEPTHEPGSICEDKGGHHDRDDEDDKPCVPPPTDGGGGGVGTECIATSDCMSGLVCTAGVCSVPRSGGPGAECLTNADCLSNVCTAGICQ